MITRVVCVCLLLTMGCSSDEEPKPSTDSTAAASDQAKSDPAESLKAAIGEGIRLLENKENTTFLEKFMVPEEIESELRGRSIAEFADSFGRSNAPDLLDALKTIQDATPTISADGLKADYQVEEGIAGEDHITFVRIDDQWRIPNKPQ